MNYSSLSDCMYFFFAWQGGRFLSFSLIPCTCRFLDGTEILCGREPRCETDFERSAVVNKNGPSPYASGLS